MADLIVDDCQHCLTPVRVQDVPFGEKDGLVVVKAQTVRQPLSAVVAAKSDQIRDLTTFGIDHPQGLAAGEFETQTSSGWDVIFPASLHR